VQSLDAGCFFALHHAHPSTDQAPAQSVHERIKIQSAIEHALLGELVPQLRTATGLM
jgi:hypothetical protein